MQNQVKRQSVVVLQRIGPRVLEREIDKKIAELNKKGYRVLSVHSTYLEPSADYTVTITYEF